MKYNKKALEKIEHIPPPIEIYSGSVILETDDPVEDLRGDAPTGAHYPRRHVFKRDKQIKSVRVIMYNNGKTEFIEAEGMGVSVELWVREQDINSDKSHMVFRTGTGGFLQVEIDNKNNSFATAPAGGTPSHRRWRRIYGDSNAKLLKVRLSISGTTIGEASAGVDKKIILIQIKTEKAAPPSLRSPQKKPM